MDESDGLSREILLICHSMCYEYLLSHCSSFRRQQVVSYPKLHYIIFESLSSYSIVGKLNKKVCTEWGVSWYCLQFTDLSPNTVDQANCERIALITMEIVELESSPAISDEHFSFIVYDEELSKPGLF